MFLSAVFLDFDTSSVGILAWALIDNGSVESVSVETINLSSTFLIESCASYEVTACNDESAL